MTDTEPEKNWFITWEEQYSQLLRNDNWYTFNIARIEFENDKIMGGYEATVIILGLGFRWRLNHTETEQMASCKQMVAEIESGTAKTRPWKETIAERPE